MILMSNISILKKYLLLFPTRGNTSVEGRGLGIDRPAELSKDDDEFDAYRKRMMLAYRFRPNPLVCNLLF